MIELEPCPECGVPKYISNEHIWLNNGDIVQRRRMWHRLVFIESENIDPLFSGIEQIIGTSIEDIVFATVLGTTSRYLRLFITKEITELIMSKRLDPEPLGNATSDMSRIMGYGRSEVIERRVKLDDDDFLVIRISDPYSVPMTIAAAAASAEVLHGCEQEVSYDQVSPTEFRVRLSPSRNSGKPRRRIQLYPYDHRDGGIELEKCRRCGSPSLLSRYSWDARRGLITSKSTGRRMTMRGAQELDVILRELREELGDEIDDVVIEAQCRFTKSGFYSEDDIADVEDFRSALALRGMGNLRELEINKRGLHMRLDNTVMHLVVLGIMQGIFETVFDTDSRVEWELSSEGDLEMEVTPLG